MCCSCRKRGPQYALACEQCRGSHDLSVRNESIVRVMLCIVYLIRSYDIIDLYVMSVTHNCGIHVVELSVIYS